MKLSIIFCLLLVGCSNAVDTTYDNTVCCEDTKLIDTQCNNDCEPGGDVCDGSDACQTCENNCLADYTMAALACGGCR
jgi:hypothetical protein